jgi:mannose-6-phosphate isomerase-like protein (cupin superfamily)
MEELCSRNCGPPPHTQEQDEVLYIIEGEVTLIAGSETMTARRARLPIFPRIKMALSRHRPAAKSVHDPGQKNLS